MKEIKREVVTEEVIAYEITKEELEKIKQEERKCGRTEGRKQCFKDIARYFWFCKENSAYVFNYGYTMIFCKDVLLFLDGQQDFVENKYNYSFKEFLEKYK